MRRRVAGILIVVLVLSAGGAWWWYSARTSSSNDVLGGSGTIEADEVVVTPQIAGRVIRARISAGDEVRTGQVLFRLDQTVAKLQVAQAEEGVRAAEAGVRQAEDADDSTAAKVDVAEAQLAQARIALQQARVQLGYTSVSAPLDGIVLSVATNAGENAVPGQAMAVIGDLRHLKVNVYIPETRIGRVEVGQKGTLTTDSLPGEFECVVTSIATEAEFTPSQIETKDQRVKLVYQIRVDVEDDRGRLKPGMPVDVTLK